MTLQTQFQRSAVIDLQERRAAVTRDLEHATRVGIDKGIFHATLSRDWELCGPSGGYIAAIALRAVGAVAEVGTPASMHCHFLSVPHFAGVELMVNALKRGRRSESFNVSMSQDGKPILEAMVRTVADAAGYEHQAHEAPRVPAPELLATYRELHPESADVPFWKNVEHRPADRRGGMGEATRAYEWIRYRPQACFDDPYVDAARSLIALDSFSWPAAKRTHPGGGYVALNLDASVWFHRFSADSAWLLVDHDCPIAGRGLMSVNGRVWDRDGRLLATGTTQLCCVPGR